jgi:zinc and cadmium transporter
MGGGAVTTLAWITVGGLAMSLLALSGSLTLLLPSGPSRVVPPLVALAAGTLIGGHPSEEYASVGEH